MFKELSDDKRKILLKIEKCIFQLIWRSDLDDYLWKVKEYGLLTIEK